MKLGYIPTLPSSLVDQLARPNFADLFADELIALSRWKACGFDREEARRWVSEPFGDRKLIVLLSREKPSREADEKFNCLIDGKVDVLEVKTREVADRALALVQVHVERKIPLSPLALKAIACVLGLVIWKPDEPPIPIKALRKWLKLPDANYPLFPHTFFVAAEVLAAAESAGDELSDSEFARRVGKGSRNALKKWRDDFDLARFADAKPDAFFPLGLAGTHDDPMMASTRVSVDWCEDVADIFVNHWRAREASRPEFKSLPADKLPVAPRVSIWRAALYRAKNGLPPTPEFYSALASVLRRISPTSGNLIGGKFFQRMTRAPSGINNPEGFLRAARLEGTAIWEAFSEADLEDAALEIFFEVRTPGTIKPNTQEGAKSNSDDANEILSTLSRHVAPPKGVRHGIGLFKCWWPANLSTIARETGVPVATLSNWRDREDFRELVLDEAFLPHVNERNRRRDLVAAHDRDAILAQRPRLSADEIGALTGVHPRLVVLYRAAEEFQAEMAKFQCSVDRHNEKNKKNSL